MNDIENGPRPTAVSMSIADEAPKDVEPAKSTVVGRPILLALEDDDGAPSFLEKALRFVEDHGEFYVFVSLKNSFVTAI
ncbi:hypothetical protein K1719_019578 [Acacia pycnantha]|nr:hypothetical protein K1719_019578 [Acacia pycnantha]